MGKLILFDFHCDACDKTFEELVPQSGGHSPVTCTTCGGYANRLLAAPRIDPKMGASTAFPSMAAKWARKRRQHQRIVERLNRDHGDIR